jgi:hypothetical protein
VISQSNASHAVPIRFTKKKKEIELQSTSADEIEDDGAGGLGGRRGRGSLGSEDQMRALRKEMMEKSCRLESIMADKIQMANRIKILEDRGQGGLGKQMDTISRLTGRVEHLEAELKITEERYTATISQLETQTIMSKDREKQIQQLQDEVYKNT